MSCSLQALVLLVLLALTPAFVIVERDSSMSTESALPGWQLIWQDEFDGPVGAPPDPEKWTPEIGGHGWGNAEWQYYTDRPENVAQNGEGALAITVREAAPDERALPCWYGPCRYTSARLLTAERFTFLYGRAEARIKAPYGQGIWPAFWSLGADIGTVGWPESGEIDIMENIGREPSTLHGTVHGPGYSGANGIGGAVDLPGGAALSDDFHVFAIEWEPGEIRWVLDGAQYFRLTERDLPQGARWVFDHPFFLLLNVAAGGHWPGYPDETSIFPQTMLVDYVRVYQAAGQGQGEPSAGA